MFKFRHTDSHYKKGETIQCEPQHNVQMNNRARLDINIDTHTHSTQQNVSAYANTFPLLIDFIIKCARKIPVCLPFFCSHNLLGNKLSVQCSLVFGLWSCSCRLHILCLHCVSILAENLAIAQKSSQFDVHSFARVLLNTRNIGR